MDDVRASGPAQASSARIRRSRDSICQDWLAAVRAQVPAAKDKPASAAEALGEPVLPK